MTFEAYELSDEQGAPAYLYEFTRQATKYLYSGTGDNVTVGGATYLALAITNNGFTKSGSAQTDALSIDLDIDSQLSRLVNQFPPSDSIGVRIRKVHINPETGEVSDAPLIWVGTIVGYRRKNAATRTLTCNSISVALTRGSLRLTYQKNCPHMLYDSQCRVNKEAFAVPVAALTVVSGTHIFAPETLTKDEGWFDGGFIEWEVQPNVYERRGLEMSDGQMIRIFGTTAGMVDGMQATLYPGCSRTIQVCNDKFANKDNYGGFPHLPGRSPFDGNPVF